MSQPSFDPEKVERFVGSDSFSDDDCVWASDYDKLLALYRKETKAYQDACESLASFAARFAQVPNK